MCGGLFGVEVVGEVCVVVIFFFIGGGREVWSVGRVRVIWLIDI